jgi:tetrahydromethanopterin S-methyltransferase subunit D
MKPLDCETRSVVPGVHFHGSSLTRSFGDRFVSGLAGGFGTLLCAYALHRCLVFQTAGDMLLRIGRFFLIELLSALFTASLGLLLWGIAAPKWLERQFDNTVRRLAGFLIVLFFLLAGGSLFHIFD